MNRQPSPMLARSADSASMPETRRAGGEIRLPPDEDPDAVTEKILALLSQQRFEAAKDLIRTAAERFPDHPRIDAARRGFVNRGKARTSPATGVPRDEESAWLQDPPGEYRGKWVALAGSEVVGAAEDLRELMAFLRGKKFSKPTLIHQVA